MILTYGECNKNTYAEKTFSQKLLVFSQFHLTKRMTSMSKFMKLHSKLCFMFLKKKKQISTLNLQMYCGLQFQFRRTHYHS
jgi:hypothetical protein